MTDLVALLMVDAPGLKRSPPAPSLVVWLGATRYYMGRRSVGVSAFCTELRAAWRFLDDETRALIERDVEEEFARDDSWRTLHQDKPWPLGDNCDRTEWETVRNLWTDACSGCGQRTVLCRCSHDD